MTIQFQDPDEQEWQSMLGQEQKARKYKNAQPRSIRTSKRPEPNDIP